MHFVFFLTATATGAYFLLRRRPFDFFTTAYAAALVYFLPGFFGFALFPVGVSTQVPSQLIPGTYVIMSCVIASLGLGAAAFDGIRKPLRSRPPARTFSQALPFALLLAGFAFALAIFEMGPSLFSPEKADILADLSRWYVLVEVTASLAFVWAYIKRWRPGLILSGALLAFDVFVGFRSNAALALLAVGTLHMHSRGARRLTSALRWRTAAIALVGALFLFGYKMVYVAVKNRDWGLVRERIQSPAFLLDAVAVSEPFTTQVVLNEVLKTQFVADPAHLTGIVYQALPFATEFGYEPVSFADLYQPRLFPGVPWGMGSNIWAEMIATGGTLLFAAFLIVFNTGLAAFSYWLRAATPELRGMSALMGSLWAFYIHRNDLPYEMTQLRRVLAISAICIACSALVALRSRRGRSAQQFHV